MRGGADEYALADADAKRECTQSVDSKRVHSERNELLSNAKAMQRHQNAKRAYIAAQSRHSHSLSEDQSQYGRYFQHIIRDKVSGRDLVNMNDLHRLRRFDACEKL